MTSTRERAIRLAQQVVQLPVADRCLVLMILLEGTIVPPTEEDEQRDDLVRRIRSTWLGALADDPASKKLATEVRRYAAGEFRSHADAEDVPKEMRGTLRGDLWRLLKLGRPLGHERYRQIFRAAGNSPPMEITTDRADK